MPKKKTTKRKAFSVKPNTDSDNGDDTGGKDSRGGKFPIVGLGASAGGLEALKTFFAAVPEDSGLAYIIVVHMASNQPSMLPELLQKVAKVPVQSAQDGQPTEPNNVYIAPPDKDISIYDGKIQLLDVVKKAVAHPIDFFFQALAQEQGGNAAAVVLSGTGTDGTSGIKDIKAENGLVFAQLSDTAAYDGMPQSAIQTGLVDKILPPAEMPQALIQYFTHPGIKTAAKAYLKPMNAAAVRKEWLEKVFAILRARVGHDFSGYKTNTLVRRISRRMGLNQIDTYEKYVRYLRENPCEVDQLFRELLIGVTHFFRDAESFDVLKNNVLPELIKDFHEDATIRVWVPGCSTGEEVYSLAMVIRECLDDIPKRINLQIFGTDIDGQAIEKAREGFYPGSVAADVSPERQQRFFTKEGNYLRIRKEIRDCAVFSVQNIIKDPPFSRLQLLCCRNLLIYLDTEAQKKLLPLFHYTLNPNGFLVLGSSETIGGFTNLFHTVDKKWKIFRRREVPDAMRPVLVFPSGTPTAELANGLKPNVARLSNANIGELTKEAILDQFAPTAILIDASGEILHIQGRTGKYLEARSGPPARDILSLAREGLRIELSSAIRAAKTTGNQITRRQVGVKTNGDIQMINLHVSPQHSPQAMAGCMLVVFEDRETISDASVSDQDAPAEGRLVSSRISELEKELQITRESHQTTIEELESANEELKSTNEELQSSNEELQSTNEELESSKEELQSLNEELQTVNAELQSKVEELSSTHDDMRNLLNSTEIATIFVDNDMCVRRFTLEAANIVNLIQTDIGRPLGHVSTHLSYGGMLDDLAEVLKSLIPKEIEVMTYEGQWYNMRIIPYRTTDNRIDGAVLTFTSISDQKEAQQSLEASVLEMKQAKDLANAISDMNPNPLVTLDKDGKCILANKAASEMMNVDAEDIIGKGFPKILEGMSATIDLESKLKGAHNDAHDFKTDAFEFEAASGKKIIPSMAGSSKEAKIFPTAFFSVLQRNREKGAEMLDHQDSSGKFERLREQAEDLIRQRPDSSPDPPPDILELIHELRVHQVELEIQNEELQRAQQEISDLHHKFENLYEFAPCGYLTLNTKGIITEANLTAVALLATEKSSLLRSAFSSFILPGWENVYLTARKKAGETGEKQSIELRLKTKDDSVLWVRADLEADREKDGSVNQWRMVLLDISLKITALEEKEKLQTQLLQAQKMEAVGTLAGGVAHDFNNLLQAINGHTQLLLMDISEDGLEYSSLKAIHNSCTRAADLIRSLLQFSRSEATERKPIELNIEVELARKVLERTIPKMVDIEVHPKGRLWPIMADSTQIEQILLNLGTNAADAMPDGGKLLFEVENITLDDDYANRRLNAQPGKYVLLTISDTGEGMDKETLEKIFEPFFTTKEFGKGTGLGLASVYGIVKSHGGYITCYSEVGQGTIFKIYFPAIEEPEVNESAPVEAKSIPGGSETILLVDDEESIRGFAQQALMKFGYKVMTASTGEEALELFKDRNGNIDLVVMDLGMPGMGGHKCLQELIKLNPKQKVIIASGYSMEKKSLESGAKGFVGKPYQLADLLNTVRAVLDGDD